jgi:hypothetical protein
VTDTELSSSYDDKEDDMWYMQWVPLPYMQSMWLYQATDANLQTEKQRWILSRT